MVMALTDQPYLPLYVDDWMNNNDLKMCSPGAHGLLITVMCLMHKSNDGYGVILLKQKFKQTNKQVYNFACQLAKMCAFDLLEIEKYLSELLDENRLIIDGDYLINKRMVKDAKTSQNRAEAGSSGGKKTQEKNKEFASTFAKAKNGANTVNVNETVNVDVNEVDNEFKGGTGGKSTPAENAIRMAWVSFRKSKNMADATFGTNEDKAIKEIAKRILSICERNGVNPDQQTLIDTMTGVLTIGYSDKWLKDRFLLSNINAQFDALFNKIKRKHDEYSPDYFNFDNK